MMDINFTFRVIMFLNVFKSCSAAVGDCIVDNIAVQDNFDLDRFSGKWYEQKFYTTQVFDPSEIYLDYIHYYTITDSGNVTNYITWRYPDTKQCGEGHGVLIQSSTPGKLTRVAGSGKVASYWVLDTDYTNYALVYGCAQVSPATGTCQDILAWVWTRSQQLSDMVAQKEQAFYETICVDASAVLTAQQTDECALGKAYKMRPDQTCTIDSFNIQEFDEDKFAGLWYEMIWITQDAVKESSVLDAFMYDFIKVDDGKLDIYLRARRGDRCIYNKIKFEATSSPKQYNYEGMVDQYSFKLPSWIVETDYNNYAVQFSCGEIDEGVCTRNELIVWSRGRSLAPQFMHRVNTIIQNMCLNPAAGFSVSQDNVCPPPWKDTFCYTNAGCSELPCLSTILTIVSLVLWFRYN